MNALQIPQYADTVVIGGGTAGAAVAGLLAERGDRSVLLLEAGPDYGSLAEGRWPSDLLDGRVLASTHDWSFTSAAANGQPGHALQRAKVIGGCSAHNGCIVIWGSRADYDGWAAAGNDGWSTAEVLPYFQAGGGTTLRAGFRAGGGNPAPRRVPGSHDCVGIPPRQPTSTTWMRTPARRSRRSTSGMESAGARRSPISIPEIRAP